MVCPSLSKTLLTSKERSQRRDVLNGKIVDRQRQRQSHNDYSMLVEFWLGKLRRLSSPWEVGEPTSTWVLHTTRGTKIRLARQADHQVAQE